MTEYRNTGTIYKSFIAPPETMKTYKEKYFYLKSVMELALFGEIISQNKEENLMNYDKFAEKILQNLDKNKMFFAKLSLINLIPNTRKCYSKYLNGGEGKEYGHLGGAPIGNKNASKNNPKTTPDIEEEKEIEKEKREKIKSIEEDAIEENNTPFRSPQGENGVLYIEDRNTLKRYGYNGNVVLTEQNIISFNDFLYRNLSTHTQIDEDTAFKGLQVIIDELDKNIEKGKEPKFTEYSNPMHHYKLLQAYIQQKLKEVFIQNFIDSLMQLKEVQ